MESIVEIYFRDVYNYLIMNYLEKQNYLYCYTGINVNNSTDNLTNCITSLASVLCTVYIMHIRTWTEAKKYQATVLMYYSDFWYSHYSCSIL